LAAGETTRLFVYGTLRQGAPMHGLIDGDARFVARARFIGRLYDLGAYPGVTDGSRRDIVHGELYELPADRSERLLDALDRYEGRSFERVIRTVTRDDGETTEAFVYLFRGDVRSSRRVRSGDFLNPSSS
jgi:gamma-glutamylcyclotransferase (GGCT)/AIG2-like uncharacterized protein YtfP